ncbi:MAG TPA: response regulator, partial [Anaeromyxobacter sp.]
MSQRAGETGGAGEAAPILVVDDERHVRSALRRLLQRMGLETAEAASAEEALEAMAGRRFSCALVDLRMPGMGGMELVRRVRAATPDFSIIIVTGHGDAEEARRCTQMGVRHFVMKPWNNAELQLAVMRVLDEARQGGPRAAEPARPDTLRIGTRIADALRMEKLPSRFAPPPGVDLGALWAGGAGALAGVARADPDLCTRFLSLARAELGPQHLEELHRGLAVFPQVLFRSLVLLDHRADDRDHGQDDEQHDGELDGREELPDLVRDHLDKALLRLIFQGHLRTREQCPIQYHGVREQSSGFRTCTAVRGPLCAGYRRGIIVHANVGERKDDEEARHG